MAQTPRFEITKTLVKGDPNKTITRWEHEDKNDRKSPKVRELGTSTFPEIIGYEITDRVKGQPVLVSKEKAIEAVAKDILSKTFAFINVDLGHRVSKDGAEHFYIRSKGVKNSFKDPSMCIDIWDEKAKKPKPEYAQVYAEYEATLSRSSSNRKTVDKQELASKALEMLAKRSAK